MKFREMPYKRVDLEEKKVQFEELMKEPFEDGCVKRIVEKLERFNITMS